MMRVASIVLICLCVALMCHGFQLCTKGLATTIQTKVVPYSARHSVRTIFMTLKKSELDNNMYKSHHAVVSTLTVPDASCFELIKKPELLGLRTLVPAKAVAQPIKMASILTPVSSLISKCIQCSIKTISAGELQDIIHSARGISAEMSGNKLLTILVMTSVLIHLHRTLKAPPILGYILSGVMVGPSGINWFNDNHILHFVGELGVTCFIFEHGLELSRSQLQVMKPRVLSLGLNKLLLTSVIGIFLSAYIGLSLSASFAVGTCLALSSSVFALQLLKDKNSVDSDQGKSAISILLLQELAMVPLAIMLGKLSIVTSYLDLVKSAASVMCKAFIAVKFLSWTSNRIVEPVLSVAFNSASSLVSATCSISALVFAATLTYGLGLSASLGALIMGLLLSASKHSHQIETAIAPVRAILLGVFFMSIGQSIDISLLRTHMPHILGLLSSILVIKTTVVASLCRGVGLPLGKSIHTGLLTSQIGEVAMILLGNAEKAGLLSLLQMRLLLTTAALSMALTPLLSEFGGWLTKVVDTKENTKL